MTRARLIVLEGRGNVTTSVVPAILPVDWYSFKSVRFTGKGGVRPLSPMTKPQLDKFVFENKTSEPVGYAIDGGLDTGSTFESLDIEFTYYKRPTILLLDEDTNPLLSKHPSLYLHAMTAAAHHIVQDTESQRVAQGEFDIALDAANDTDKFAALSGGTPQMTGD